ncbi:hypothetical protein Pla110_18680 [Polystyrenella longa]|uniref:Uncharacterized protein n=1 Tax=Polystyrenella longa TaxID=2528007 RepID=A0A518CLN5_9PLAN|nr:hypothetical protein Pla110_18680 [Polystyrenella longa]
MKTFRTYRLNFHKVFKTIYHVFLVLFVVNGDWNYEYKTLKPITLSESLCLFH